MSEVLIKGLKIKDYPQTITINPDGSVIKDTFGLHRLVEEWKAIEVEAHGRLIDADKVSSQDIEFCLTNDRHFVVINSPTVIEASTEDNE